MSVACAGDVLSKGPDGRDYKATCGFILLDSTRPGGEQIRLTEIDWSIGVGVCPCCRAPVRIVDLYPPR